MKNQNLKTKTIKEWADDIKTGRAIAMTPSCALCVLNYMTIFEPEIKLITNFVDGKISLRQETPDSFLRCKAKVLLVERDGDKETDCGITLISVLSPRKNTKENVRIFSQLIINNKVREFSPNWN